MPDTGVEEAFQLLPRFPGVPVAGVTPGKELSLYNPVGMGKRKKVLHVVTISASAVFYDKIQSGERDTQRQPVCYRHRHVMGHNAINEPEQYPC